MYLLLKSHCYIDGRKLLPSKKIQKDQKGRGHSRPGAWELSGLKARFVGLGRAGM